MTAGTVATGIATGLSMTGVVITGVTTGVVATGVITGVATGVVFITGLLTVVVGVTGVTEVCKLLSGLVLLSGRGATMSSSAKLGRLRIHATKMDVFSALNILKLPCRLNKYNNFN
jgi:hypothetical protein